MPGLPVVSSEYTLREENSARRKFSKLKKCTILGINFREYGKVENYVRIKFHELAFLQSPSSLQ